MKYNNNWCYDRCWHLSDLNFSQIQLDSSAAYISRTLQKRWHCDSSYDILGSLNCSIIHTAYVICRAFQASNFKLFGWITKAVSLHRTSMMWSLYSTQITFGFEVTSHIQNFKIYLHCASLFSSYHSDPIQIQIFIFCYTNINIEVKAGKSIFADVHRCR